MAVAAAPKPSFETKVSVARSKLCGQVIIEVRNIDEAMVAKSAGAHCVLLATPSQAGGRCTSYNYLIKAVKRNDPSILMMGMVRIGHTREADALETMGCQFIDESELLNVADEENFLNKHELGIPCVCGCQNLGEALKRIGEGAAIIRIQGETSKSSGIGKTVKNLRSVLHDVRALRGMNEDALREFSARTGAPFDLVVETQRLERLPVPTFAAGGIATVDDALLLMDLGCDGVFVGAEIFDSGHGVDGFFATSEISNNEYLRKDMESMITTLDSYGNGGIGETNQSTAEKGSTSDQ